MTVGGKVGLELSLPLKKPFAKVVGVVIEIGVGGW